MMKPRNLRLLVTVVATLLLAACSIEAGDPGPGMTKTINVSPDSYTLVVGDSVSYRATAYDNDGNVLRGRFWEWGTTNEGVARVSPDGTVTAIAPGSATILATADDRMGGSRIVVVKKR
jgi:uncharacterized protein YjdB